MDDALARRARDQGVAKAALIREYLGRHVEPAREAGDDPSGRLIGAYSGREDESASVDDVVYGR